MGNRWAGQRCAPYGDAGKGAALAALAAQPEEAKAGTFAEHPRWDEWVDYLTRAAAHGGFRVE